MKEFEWRKRRAEVKDDYLPGPEWSGTEDLKDKTLLIRAEMALGEAGADLLAGRAVTGVEQLRRERVLCQHGERSRCSPDVVVFVKVSNSPVLISVALLK